MAIITTSQVLHDGVRNAVVQLTGRSDGSGQESNVVKVDVSELSPPCDAVKVRKLDYTVIGGLVVLSWAADENVPFLNLAGQGCIDYGRIAGLVNGADDSATGDILLSTQGFELDSAYSLVIELIKKGA